MTRTVTVTRTVTQPSAATATCTASQLAGAFDLIRGSAGAGQISYTLKLTNTSSSGCTLGGASSAQLLSVGGSALPTHIVPSTASLVLVGAQLAPGASSTVSVRFSPSVPGSGDSTSGPCQPKAYTLDVTFNSGTVPAHIKPPTSVCESGTLNFDASATP